MPEIVKTLTENEQLIEKQILGAFTEEQICAYFLAKNLRSIYQFDDDFIDGWYAQLFDVEADAKESKRVKLALAYAEMLLVKRQYGNHMKYWIRLMQHRLMDEMKSYFAGNGGK